MAADGVQRNVLWNELVGRRDGREISSSSEDMQHQQQQTFAFRSPQDTSMCGYSQSSHEVGSSQRFKLTQGGGNSESSEEELSPLGLTLRKTPSFINFVETTLNEMRQRKPSLSPPPPPPSPPTLKQQKMEDRDKLDNEKLKASNFPALHLKIGNWERISSHEADLVAKCYYKKGRLVWETLEGALKSKIEIQWSDIGGIRASKTEDEFGILEIELNEKPLFFKETNPQPRKHTLWQQADDFTGGEALIHRRHWVKFAPGTLDKHYERLLQYDQRLFMLSQRPFPSKHSPYFPTACGLSGFSFDFHGYQPPHIHQTAQCPYYQSFPSSMASHAFHNPTLTAGPQIAFLDSNPTPPTVLNNQNMAFLNEATNIGNANYVQVARPITSVVPNNMDFPNYPNMGLADQDFNVTIIQGQGTGISTPNPNLFGIQHHLLDENTQFVNEKTVLANASPISSSLIPFEVVGGRSINEQAIQNVGVGEHDCFLWSESYSLPPQHEEMTVEPSANKSFYAYGLQNQPNGSFCPTDIDLKSGNERVFWNGLQNHPNENFCPNDLELKSGNEIFFSKGQNVGVNLLSRKF